MKIKTLHTAVALMALSILGACNDTASDIPYPEDTSVPEIFATSGKMKAAPGIEEASTDEPQLIEHNTFAAGSLLYFSQKGPNALNPNFTNPSESGNPYQYIYQYYPNDATWAEGYNFKVYNDPSQSETRLGFDWVEALNIGPDGNIFKFFAFHFPVDNRIRWNVETDQTGGNESPYDTDNFLKSDILGAYHATSAPFTRMRFRLFHLMTYLRVTIYVPVFNGSADDYTDQSFSGFLPEALQGGYVLNAYTNFNIDWAAARSSDTDAPLVILDDKSTKNNIKMYRHEGNDEISYINVREFYTGQVDGLDENNVDEVRTYDFSVLFPTQTFGDNFLCFALQSPGGDTKYYYFSGSQVLPNQESSYGLTQGTLQQLYLYLPRKTNQTILVGAKIIPWESAVTDMTVNKQNNE